MSDRIPAEVFRPGEYIQDELDARGWRRTYLARISGLSARRVIHLIMGKASISQYDADHLAKAFGQDAQTWLNLEEAWQTALQRRRTASDAPGGSIAPPEPLESP